MIATKTITGITLACALAVGLACAGVRKKTVDINPSMNRAPTCAAAIAVYNSRADVPYDYYELAWIEAQGNSVWTTDNQLQQQIRNGAAKVGASLKDLDVFPTPEEAPDLYVDFDETGPYVAEVGASECAT